MTDGQREAGLELFEVAQARRALREAARARRERGERLGRRAQILALREQLAQAQPGTLAVTEAAALVEVARVDDPATALRSARLGAVTALVLALALWWFRQRRNG